ncbi:MAG: hypothetical protein V4739_11755 [Pseudomonadota bacterium]
MQAEGIMFLGKTRPTATTAADGTFQLLLLVMDPIGTYQREPWRITWAGEEARAFWEASQHALTPGQPLRVKASHMQAFQQRHIAPEIHARALLIELAPRSTDKPHQRQAATA